jgi:hypothetical protein
MIMCAMLGPAARARHIAAQGTGEAMSDSGGERDDELGPRASGPRPEAAEPEGARATPGQVDATAFLRLSDGLRIAFAEVAGAKLNGDERARWQRRLIAVTTVAKRDLDDALEMLERFERDWSARRR